MSEVDALEIVEKRLLGQNSILVKIKMGYGFDKNEYDELVVSIKILTNIYREAILVPKRLALAFVDISNYFYINEGLYSDEDLNKMEDAVHEIVELANVLFE